MLAHSIEEHDQVKLLSSLGYNVFSLGGYIDPARPHDPKRPALEGVARFPGLQAVVDKLGTDNNLESAKRHIPDDILDWCDIIICHHYEYRWLWPQWERLAGKRVIWRTVGQSTRSNELAAAEFRKRGLEIVRYSPREEWIPGYAGRDALIRFYKDPDEWQGWTGSNQVVINITQHLMQRGDATNPRYWLMATAGLPSKALGPGSTVVGGPGEMTLLEMQTWLRESRAYLYTGTQPASYTLGLIEAMMTGIPIFSIGPSWMQMYERGNEIYEGHLITERWADNPNIASAMLRQWLDDYDLARAVSEQMRAKAIYLFGMDTIGEQWRAYLG